MKFAFPIVLILCFLLGTGNRDTRYGAMSNASYDVLDKAPEFYVLQWKKGTQLSPEKTDFFIEVDAMGKQEVFALMDTVGKPVLYASNVRTPVCADGECKLMNIRLYWTLLGEYAGFDRYSELPLTKHNHDEFKAEDYQKLHALLTDDKSILGRRSIDQLVEKPKMRSVNGIDAVSGATVARVKESVVSGALYSCYVAWYLVHGNIRDSLKNHTLSVLSEPMVVDMLYSINDDYQLFALEHIEIPEYKKHYKQIAKVFTSSTPLVRSIITKRLTSKYKDAPDLQKPFWEAFDAVDSGSRSLLIKYLDEAPDYVTGILSNKLGSMSKNQLKGFLEVLSTRETLDNQTRNSLLEFAHSENEIYAYLAQEFLEENN